MSVSDACGGISGRAVGRRLAPLLAAVALLLCSCTAVPTSSSPTVVRSLDLNGASPPLTVTPQPGADARSIVEAFLDAGAANDPNHNSARSFLTAEEKNRWADSTITVVDHPFAGNLVQGKVTVRGQEIGTIDPTGVYTPALRGDGTGTGGVPVTQVFGMKQVKGEWRIDSLPNGLLISDAQFEQYQQRFLYFFDASESRLVPDPRYTQLVDQRDLAVWLIAQLAQGPRGGLATGLPDQTDPKRVQVEFPPDSGSQPTRIEIPGSAQLDRANLNRLAAQIAGTLGQLALGQIEITDGANPVRIPAIGQSIFGTDELAGLFATTPPVSTLVYIRDGAVLEESGRRLPGKVGTGVYGLTSVAVTQRAGSNKLQIAGVRGSGKNEVLDIGTADQLVATKVHGELSRPAWAPLANEVWIGAGTDLCRVSAAGGGCQVIPVDAAAGKASGIVTAVRLSPEGARVALVLTGPDGTSQVYVGAVVRTLTSARVTELAPITPQGISVTDVAWNDQLKLFTIGTDRSTGNFGVYEVQCDGSLWTPRGTTGLPGTPDSVTVAANSVAVVSTSGTVERQQASAWEGLQGEETRGTNPIYAE